MSQNHMIIFLCFFTIFVSGGYNACGISVTKYASAAQRSTIDTARTFSIWLVSLALGMEPFVALQIPGYILLTFGTLLYNEIIVLPFCGFNENTKDAIAKRQGLDERMSQRIANQGYTAPGSPGKAYDSQRRDRSLTAKMVDQYDENTRQSMKDTMQMQTEQTNSNNLYPALQNVSGSSGQY